MRKTFLASAIALSVLSAAYPARSAEAPKTPAAAVTASPKIVVVNVQEVMRNSKAAKSMMEQLEKKRSSYEAEFSKQQSDLKKTRQDIEKQKGVLSQDALGKKQKEFEATATKAVKKMTERKQAMEKAYAKALGEIQKNLQGIIEDMAKAQGFTVAIPTSQLIYADKSMDITDEIIKKLDDKLPKVEVVVEEK